MNTQNSHMNARRIGRMSLSLAMAMTVIAGLSSQTNVCGSAIHPIQASANDLSNIKSEVIPGARVIEPERMTQQFASGSQMVEVLVNLKPPVQAQATNFRNADSVANMQAAVAQTQDALLMRRMGADMSLHHRLENQATLWVSVTSKGLEELRQDPTVESIEAIREYRAYDIQGLALMKAEATRQQFGGAGMSIAICDTGVDYRHPQLGGGGFPNSKVIGGFDFGSNDFDPLPEGNDSHGTECAGIAAGDLANVGDYNGGVAPDAKLYALKITDGDGNGSNSALIASAWDFCVTHQNDDPGHPIMVISTSFGGGREFANCDANDATSLAAQNAVAAGMTVVVASGNEGFADSIASPACLSTAISVGAVYDASFGSAGFGICQDNSTAADQVTCYSNTSNILSLLAPSHLAFTTDIVGSAGASTGNFSDQFGGTSAACPYAAGAVAALQSAAKQKLGQFLSPAQIKQLMISTGDSITDPKAGIAKPRINLGRAIASLLAEPPPPGGDDAFEPNNDPASAKLIQAGTHQLVGKDDDLFVIDMASAGSLSVQLAAADGDLDLVLFVVQNGELAVLGSSENDQSSNESVEVDAPAGPVLIVATPFQNRTTNSYTMTIANGTPPETDDAFEENDDVDSAKPITAGTHQLVGIDPDVFILTAAAGTVVSVQIAGAEGNLDLLLANGAEDFQGNTPGSSNEAGQITSVQGFVAIVVQPANGAVCRSYTMTISAGANPPTSSDDKFEENDDISQAKSISTGTLKLQGQDNDFFRVEVPAGETLRINVNGDEGDLDLAILDSKGAIVATSAEPGSIESIEAEVIDGSIFIAVSPFEGKGSAYTLTIEKSTSCTEGLCGTGTCTAIAPLFMGLMGLGAMKRRRGRSEVRS